MGVAFGAGFFLGPLLASFLSTVAAAVASDGLFTNLSTVMQRSVRPCGVGRGQGTFVLTCYVAATFLCTVSAQLVGGRGWGGAGLVQVVLVSLAGGVLLPVGTSAMIRRVAEGAG